MDKQYYFLNWAVTLPLVMLLSMFSPILSSKCLQFRLGEYYQSNMVLQSAAVTSGANIWGWGCAGSVVNVKVSSGDSVSTHVNGEGWWTLKVMLSPGGPYNLTLTQTPAVGVLLSPETLKIENVLSGDVWMCVGSDDMALPMASVTNKTKEQLLKDSNVRFMEVKKAWTEEPQLDLIGGMSIPWTTPTTETLPMFSATCWMFGQRLSEEKKIPVGLVGVYVNKTDIWPWSPTKAVFSECARESLMNHTDSRGYWNGMLSPLFNTTALGAILYEGEMDVERDINGTMYRCLLNQTITTWIQEQKLIKFALVGLGNNNFGGGNNLTWAQLRYKQSDTIFQTSWPFESIPGAHFVPTFDLPDPGQRVSRHKSEVTERIVKMTGSESIVIPPTIQKACYVYIYIALIMSESISVKAGSPTRNQGFSSCCVSDRTQVNQTCLDSGPNGDIGVLTSDNDDGSFLFAQECKTFSGESGIVNEIFYGWVEGYPYLNAPLYGKVSKLPATTSWAKVIHDDHDPMCVH